MLPAHLQELLTAAVDGELNAAERRLVEKLLRDSDGARGFHGQLLKDAQRLQQLPSAAPGDDLATNVLNIIAERAMRPTPLPMPRRKSTWNAQRLLPWVSISAAAMVMISVSMLSYLYFAASERQLVEAAKKQKSAGAIPPIVEPGKHVAKQSRPVEPLSVEILPQPRDTGARLLAQKAPASERLDVYPRAATERFPITSPYEEKGESLRGETLEGLPLILPLQDLDRTNPKQSLRAELTKDEVVRIDLFAKDAGRASEVLQNALKARGIHIIVDALVQERLKKKLPTDLVFFTESLTAEEIAQLLEHVGSDDKRAELKKAGDGLFDKFVLARFQPRDLSSLAKLLGIPAGQVKLPKVKGAASFDMRKSLESLTASHIASSLPKGSAASNQKVTLVLSYSPVHAKPETSKEIKAFLEKRGERKVGVVPMMLVVVVRG